MTNHPVTTRDKLDLALILVGASVGTLALICVSGRGLTRTTVQKVREDLNRAVDLLGEIIE